MFCKVPAKTQIFETIWKIYLTERNKCFRKIDHISFVTWAVTKNNKKTELSTLRYIFVS